MFEKHTLSRFWRNAGVAFVASSALVFANVALSAPAKKASWLATFAQSSVGGTIIGNPNARVKVIEYGSYTCPHCAQFEKQDMPLLKRNFIATGKVSFEFRNLVRDPIDLSVAVLARCGGTARFYKNHQLLMASHDTWMAKADTLSAATTAKLAAKNASFMFGVYQDLGLGAIMAPVGLTKAQAQACFADPKALNQVQAMTLDATQNLNLHGTPSFLINGKFEHDISNMASLRPYLPYD
jgi:protein-disulfide isomerase